MCDNTGLLHVQATGNDNVAVVEIACELLTTLPKLFTYNCDKYADEQCHIKQ